MSRYLFLSAPFGTGHWKAAQAAAAQTKEQQPEATCYIADLFQYHHPRLGTFLSWAYVQMLRYFPSVYGSIYGMVESRTAGYEKRILQQVLSTWLGNAVIQFIRTVDPDVIVATHPYSLALLSRLREEGRLITPFMGIVTDFSIHSLWVYPETDTLCVATEPMKEDVVRLGIDPSRVVVTGIPVEKRFTVNVPKHAARQSLGLPMDSRPTVLVMGGGLGLGPLEQVAHTMVKLPDIQSVIVTGKNERVYDRLTHVTRNTDHVEVVQYVENVDLFMSAADVLVTKPGGLTLAEALVKRKPIVFMDALPGQEEQNARYLTQMGIARSADPNTFGQVIGEMVYGRWILAEMITATEKCRFPEAADAVARTAIRLGKEASPGKRYYAITIHRPLLQDRLEVL